MQLSFIIATYNRAYAIADCLDAIAASILRAGMQADAEIVVVNNNSSDATAEVITAWAMAHPAILLQALFEPKQGVSAARNRAINAARGALLVFTDDDCRPAPDYVAQALAYDAADQQPVIRGGRVELGDTTDLPLTIKTNSHAKTWSLAESSARHENLALSILGCNMCQRKTTAMMIGGFDETIGPGCRIPASEDTDYLYRAYLMGITLAYVPDMTMQHFHGRKTPADGYCLVRNYCIGNGAIFVKYMFRHPTFLRPL